LYPEPVIGAGGDEYDTTPDDGPTRAQRGDIWALGQHRLLVDDCTIAANVARLMGEERAAIAFTSPPYNAGDSEKLSGNTHTTDTKYVLGGKDALIKSGYLELLNGFTQQALDYCAFVFVNVQSLAGNKVALVEWLYQWREHLADVAVWSKSQAAPAMAENVMTSAFELFYVFSGNKRPTRAIGTRQFRGDVRNVIEGNSASAVNEFAEIHAATFPLYVPTWAIENFCNPGEAVLDSFGGTGTTLIAAERLNRRARLMEIEPRYADVILRRWEAETGREAALVERVAALESIGSDGL
jgi:DNA modification methylase